MRQMPCLSSKLTLLLQQPMKPAAHTVKMEVSEPLVCLSAAWFMTSLMLNEFFMYFFSITLLCIFFGKSKLSTRIHILLRLGEGWGLLSSHLILGERGFRPLDSLPGLHGACGYLMALSALCLINADSLVQLDWHTWSNEIFKISATTAWNNCLEYLHGHEKKWRYGPGDCGQDVRRWAEGREGAILLALKMENRANNL